MYEKREETERKKKNPFMIGKIDLEEKAKITEKETEFSRKIDDALAEQGYRTKDMWPKCTIGLTLVLLILTCFVCFYKPDFLNLSVCVLAIYILEKSTQDDMQSKFLKLSYSC
jgi:hypothetical protein